MPFDASWSSGTFDAFELQSLVFVQYVFVFHIGLHEQLPTAENAAAVKSMALYS